MTNHHKTIQKNNRGVALLMSIIFMSVVFSIGVFLSDINLKQINFSVSSQDSELAVHAAEAALECMRAVEGKIDFFKGNTITDGSKYACFGLVDKNNKGTVTFNVSGNETKFQADWKVAGRSVCSEAELHTIDAITATSPKTVSTPIAYTCAQGNFCKIILARGLNQECVSSDTIRTVQREFIYISS